MPRRKSAVVSPSPELTKSVLRRSARLIISRENCNSDEKPREEHLVSGSNPTPIPTEDDKPPRKSRRKLGEEVSKRLVHKLVGSIEDTKKSTLNGICSVKRSLRVSNWECSDSKREKKSEIVSTESHRRNTSEDGSTCTPRRSPRFSSVVQSKSGTSIVLGKGEKMVESRKSSKSFVRSSKSKEIRRACEEDEVSVCVSDRKKKRPKIELGVCSESVVKANKGKRRGKNLVDDEERLKKKKKLVESSDGNCRKSKRNCVLPKACDEEDEVSVSFKSNVECIDKKRLKKTVTANSSELLPKGNQWKTKKKPVEESKVWRKDQELALQRAYLTANPSPNFWKKVSKMVHGKSAHECFDRMHKDQTTPPQLQPRSRAKKASQRSRNNQSKKTIRELLEKQKDQSPGFDLFSVLEPNVAVLSTPLEKTIKILEFPSSSSGSKLKPCSRFKTGTVISPLVLKQVKNKVLHEKYIDQLHNREAKRRVADVSSKRTGKENVVIKRFDSLKAAKDAIYFDVQEAIQKLKSIECDENSSSSCDDETEEED